MQVIGLLSPYETACQYFFRNDSEVGFSSIDDEIVKKLFLLAS